MEREEQEQEKLDSHAETAGRGQSEIRRALSALIILLALVAISLIGQALWSGEKGSETVAKVPASITLPEHLDIEAKSAYVLDVRTGDVLFEKNAETQLPLASVAKLMSVLSAARVLSPNETIAITSDAISIEGDSGFHIGDRFRARDLIDFTLVTSSNDGAYAIANAAFPETVSGGLNEAASALELSQTFFINPTGLDATKSLSGAYGSARDVAHLVQEVLTYDATLLEATQYPAVDVSTLDGEVYHGTSTAKDIADISGIIGLKTGFTDLAGGNLVVAFDAGFGRPFIAVVLGSTVDGRFADMRTLIEATRNAISTNISS